MKKNVRQKAKATMFRKLLAVILSVMMIVPVMSMAFTAAAASVIPDDASEFNGHYYKVYDEGMTWSEAKEYCEDLGGHLATITSQEEQTFIESILANGEKNVYWLGAKRNSSRQFEWVTGESFQYTHFGRGNPDHANYENALMMYRIKTPYYYGSFGEWNDLIEEGTFVNQNDFYGVDHFGLICEWDSVQNGTVTGMLTGSSSSGKIKIDDFWYPYDTSNSKLSDLIGSWVLNTQISCRVESGTIVSCSKYPINNKTITSLYTTAGNKVTYDASSKKYSFNNIGLDITVTNRLTSSRPGTINTSAIAGFDAQFNKVKVILPDTSLLYFKDGLFNLGKANEYISTQDSSVNLEPGQLCQYSYSQTQGVDTTYDICDKNLEMYVNDSYKWGDSECSKDIPVTVEIYNGDSLISSVTQNITFKNPAAEESARNIDEIYDLAGKSAKILNDTTCVIQNEFLSKVFSKEKLALIQYALQCKIALSALPESTYKEAGISDNIISKIMSKGGVSKDWVGTAYTANISLLTVADNSDYGDLEIEFDLPATYYSFGSDNPYGGISFDLSYKVTGGKGMKKVPSNKLTGDKIGCLTYASMDNFSESVKKVADKVLESAFNLGYGNDLNTVSDMLFGDTVTYILSQTKYQSYSHLAWSAMTSPSKKVFILCPVDVYVYNSDGELCACVIDNEITKECEDIDITVVGDKKYFTIYDGNYSLKYVATATDKMDILVYENANNDETVRSVAFNNIELKPGDTFTSNITGDYIDENYSIVKNDSGVINADTDVLNVQLEQFTVSAEATDGGNVTGMGKYKDGSSVTLYAKADDGYKFVGWYDSENKLISEDETLQFTALSDCSNKAVFAALVNGITISPDSVTIEEGKTQQLTATVTPDNAADKSVTWTSGDESIATVSADGIVTAVKEGTAVITCSANDGSGAEATVTVTVTKKSGSDIMSFWEQLIAFIKMIINFFRSLFNK